MKNILSIILTLQLALGVCVTTYASGDSWFLKYQEPSSGQAPINMSTENFKITDATDANNSSTKSLCANFAHNQNTDGGRMFIQETVSALINGEDYDVSFHAKGVFDSSGVWIGIGTDEHATRGSLVRLSRTSRYTVEDVGNGWSKYSFTVNYDEDNPMFQIIIGKPCSSFYIDNIYLGKSGEDANLIDGTFETAVITKENPVTSRIDEKYYPANVIATERDGLITVSWRNPSDAGLSAVKLYEVIDGVKSVIGAPGAGVSEHNFIPHTDLETGSIHNYIIECSFSNGYITEFAVTAKATLNTRVNVPLFSLSYNDGSPKFFPGTIYLRSDVGHDANGAMHLISNRGVWASGTYMAVVMNENLDDTKKYKLTFWAKVLGKTFITFNNNWEPFAAGSDEANINVTTSSDWKEYTYYIEGKSSLSLRIQSDMYADVLFDDVRLIEVADDAEPLVEETFEMTDVVLREVQNLKSEVVRSTAKLNWTPCDAETIRFINVYLKNPKTGVLVKCGQLSSFADNVQISNLLNDAEYTFVLKTTNVQGKESDGMEIAVIPTPEDLEYTMPVLLESGIVQQAVTNGTLSVKTELKNNKIEGGVSAQLVVCVTNDNELIQKFATPVTSVPKTDYSATPITLNLPITLTDISDGEYEIQAFVFDNLADMNPIMPYSQWNELQE